MTPHQHRRIRQRTTVAEGAQLFTPKRRPIVVPPPAALADGVLLRRSCACLEVLLCKLVLCRPTISPYMPPD